MRTAPGYESFLRNPTMLLLSQMMDNIYSFQTIEAVKTVLRRSYELKASKIAHLTNLMASCLVY